MSSSSCVIQDLDQVQRLGQISFVSVLFCQVKLSKVAQPKQNGGYSFLWSNSTKELEEERSCHHHLGSFQIQIRYIRHECKKTMTSHEQQQQKKSLLVVKNNNEAQTSQFSINNVNFLLMFFMLIFLLADLRLQGKESHFFLSLH